MSHGEATIRRVAKRDHTQLVQLYPRHLDEQQLWDRCFAHARSHTFSAQAFVPHRLGASLVASATGQLVGFVRFAPGWRSVGFVSYRLTMRSD